MLQVGGSVGGLTGAIIATLSQPSGDALLANLKSGTGGISAQNSSVLLRGIATGAPRVAVRTGTEHVGMPSGVTIRRFGTIDGNGTATFFFATLQGLGVSSASNLALCVAPDGGTVRVLVSKGDRIDGKTVAVIGTLVASAGTLAEGRWRVNDTTIGVRLTFNDKSQGVFAIPAHATSPADWTQLVKTGPSSGITNLDGVTISSLGLPAFGTNGMAVLAYLAKAPGSVTVANNVALITSNSTTASALLAGKGDPITTDADDNPLAAVTIRSLGDPIVGGNGAVAFMLTATGKGVGTGIAYAADGTAWKLLSNVGSSAPSGGQWSRFSALVLPNGAQSGPLFLGKLKASKHDNISARNDTGLWGVNSDGVLQLLLRTGQTVSMGSANKTLRTFIALGATPGSIGAASGHDDNGHVNALVTFTDMSQAILKISIP